MPIWASTGQVEIPSPDHQKLRRATEQRLEFIEFRLFWEGGVNRSDLTERFGVSVPQASIDLAAYREVAPDNVAYDLSGKRYVPSSTFKPKFLRPNPDRYLAQLGAMSDGILDIADTWLASLPATSVLPIPRRRIDPRVLRAVLAAIRGRLSLHIEYQSTNPDHAVPMWRWITPHALGFDGFRWHARAFCHLDSRFKDFILGRCLATGDGGAPAVSAEDDRLWNTLFSVVLKANPDLNEGHRRAVALDYNMTDDKIEVPVRLALLHYFYKRLRLDVAHLEKPRQRSLIVANQKEFQAALEAADNISPLTQRPKNNSDDSSKK